MLLTNFYNMNTLMKSCRQSVLVALLATGLFLSIGTAKAHAASFYISPASGTYVHGCTNSVRVIINTGGVASNAADIVLRTENIKITGIRGGNAYTNYAGGGTRFTGFSIGSELNGTATFATISFQNENEAQKGSIQFVVGGSTNSVIADTSGSNILSGASGATYTFEPGSCVADSTPPKLVNADPANGAKNVPLNSNIKFNLTDETGVNIDSVVVSIEGITYSTKTPSNFNYSGSSKNYAINIDPIKDFEPEKEISVNVIAEDTSDRKNKLDTTYSFNRPLPPEEEPPTCEDMGCISQCPAVPAEFIPSLIEALKRPLFESSENEKLKNHFAAVEFEPEISCVPKMESEERKVQMSSVKQSVDLPEGYEVIGDPITATCKTPFNMTVNIPNIYEDVRVLKCAGDNCFDGVAEMVDTTTCDEEIRDVNRKNIEYASNYQERNLEEKTVQISANENVLESNKLQIAFSGDINKEVAVKIENAKEDFPEASNPGLKIVGSPAVATVYADTHMNAKISMPFSLTDYTYPESAAIYAYKNNKYIYVGGSVDLAENKVIAEVEDITSLRDNDGKIKLTVMSVICSNCAGSDLRTAYQPEEGSNTVVVLVHGLSGTAATFGDIIHDIKQTKQNYTVMTFDYTSSSMSLEEIVEDFRTMAGPKLEKYKNIIIVGHSVGSLIAQQALHESGQARDAYVKNVKKFISIAAPNKGALESGSYRELFKALVNKPSKYNDIFDLNSKLFSLLTEGKEIPQVRGVDYYAIAGTKPYGIIKNVDTEKEHDGIVTTESATAIGGENVDNQCSDYWKLNLNHSDLTHDFEARKILARIIREVSEDAKKPTLGNNRYVSIFIDECAENIHYILIGKRAEKLKTIQEGDCSCGDGFCGMDEDRFLCPVDCAIFGSKITKGHFVIFVFALIALGFITLGTKIRRLSRLNDFLKNNAEDTCKRGKNTFCTTLKKKMNEYLKQETLWKKILIYTGIGLGIIILLVLLIG